MSALESVINQKLKEFDKKKTDFDDLRQKIKTLQDELKHEEDSNILQEKQNQLKTLETELQKSCDPKQDELNYLMQVGYLLYTMENEEEEFINSKKNEKSFYGCSVKVEKQKGLAYKRYMAEVEKSEEYMGKLANEYYNVNTEEVCNYCGGDLITNRECTYCKNCAIVHDYLRIDSSDAKNSITYEQQVNEVVTLYSYNRLNHMNEWLSKLQAREMTNIPNEVMDALRLELKKARVTNPKDITQKKVKELLKKLKLSKYYEHVPNITNMLTGAEAPRFPPHLEDRLRFMFEQIQQPFEMYCPKNRKNFLHYGYVLYKFCELLGEDQYLSYIPMLKSFDKLYVQDQIWKQICSHLKWQYIPSV